jgi:histidyl-tRNA synthetase
MKVTAIKGFSDILPGEVEIWQRVESAARKIFAAYNFAEIRIPIVEKTELFSRSLGETTDIVEKEMYTFPDQDAKSSLLTLRPEGTAGVVRAYVESELFKTEPVQKLYYLGPMFRRERPQKG